MRPRRSKRLPARASLVGSNAATETSRKSSCIRARLRAAGVRDLVNLVVDLDGERFSPSSAFARGRRCRSQGFSLEERRSADDTTLAWMTRRSAVVELGSVCVAEPHRAARRRAGGICVVRSAGVWTLRGLRGGRVEPGTGVFGPFGVAAEERGGVLGAALLTASACVAARARVCARVIPAVGDEALVRYYAEHAGARRARRFPHTVPGTAGARGADGVGERFEFTGGARRSAAASLRWKSPRLCATIRGRMDRACARRGRLRACTCWPWQRKAGETRNAYDARLLETVAGERPDIVLLLGWMHLLDARFVNAMPALLNVHPRFCPLDPERDAVGMPDGTEIPAFRGPFAVRDALAAGSSWAGASVHHVTAKTDRGGVLVRAPLNIEEGESEEDVLTRLHPVEHALVARADLALDVRASGAARNGGGIVSTDDSLRSRSCSSTTTSARACNAAVDVENVWALSLTQPYFEVHSIAVLRRQSQRRRRGGSAAARGVRGSVVTRWCGARTGRAHRGDGRR